MDAVIVRALRTCQEFASRETTFPRLHVPIAGMIDTPDVIGPRLKALRIACGYRTQQSFAAAIGVERNTYNPWEKGVRPLTFEGAILIRKRFHIPLDYLFYGDLQDDIPARILARLQEAA